MTLSTGQILFGFGWHNSANFTLVIIQSLKKIRNRLKVFEKEKISIISENTIESNKDNVTRKKDLLKNSEQVDYKDTNLEREDFSHISELGTIVENKLGTIVENKERGP